MNLKQLRERRGQLESQYNAIIRNTEREDRDINDDEASQLSDIAKEEQQLKNRIERQEHATNWGKELDQPVDRKISGPGSHASENLRDIIERATDDMLATAGFFRNSMGYPVPADEAEACQRLGHHLGANSMEQRFKPQRPEVGNRLSFTGQRIQNSLATTSPSTGGVLVPSGFMARLEVALKQFAPMMQLAEVWISEDGREVPWPTLDDTAAEGSQLAEGQTVPDSDMSLKATKLAAHKFSSGMIVASHELLRDSAVNLGDEIATALGVRLGRVVNRLATVGNGAATISGLVPSAAVGKTTASATAITGDELIDLSNSIDPAYKADPSCAFMMHQDVFAAISKLKDGNGVYLLSQLADGQSPTLRGYPVVINPAMSSSMTASERVIVFGRLKSYKLRIVSGVRLRKLEEKYADSDQTGFCGFLEADGALLDAGTNPVKCLVMHA